MKIAIIGANGKAGQLIVQAALERDLDVSAIARTKNQSRPTAFIQKDLFDLAYADLESFDVIVDAFGVWDAARFDLHMTSLQHLASLLAAKPNRLLVVGGAGSLYMDSSHTQTLRETADFPDAFKPLATAMASGLDFLRTQTAVRWTYLSPAADFQADGSFTGNYRLAGEVFEVNDDGVSEISYADYAQAMIDVALSESYLNERISVLAI